MPFIRRSKNEIIEQQTKKYITERVISYWENRSLRIKKIVNIVYLLIPENCPEQKSF